MQEELSKKFQFFKSFTDINESFLDNQGFVSQVKRKLFPDKVYVYISNSEIVELPSGSTIIDLVCKLGTDIGNTLIGAKINDEYIYNLGYELKNKDRVIVLTDELLYGSREGWIDKAKTSYAKKTMKFRK